VSSYSENTCEGFLVDFAIETGGERETGCASLHSRFFDCWWALFGNRAAENNDEGDSVY